MYFRNSTSSASPKIAHKLCEVFFKTLLTISLLTVCFSSLHAQHENQILKEAYQKKSTKTLEKFVKQWKLKSKPIGSTELAKLNDTLKNAYLAFSTFYNFDALKNKNLSSRSIDLPNMSLPITIQNSLEVYVTEKIYHSDEEIEKYIIQQIYKTTEDEEVRKKLTQKTNGKLPTVFYENYSPDYNKLERLQTYKLTNFRPVINNTLPKLYLTQKYDQLLTSFLNTKIGGDAKTERENRIDFLKTGLEVEPNFPIYVSSISFDKNLAYAIIYFSNGYKNGEALLKRIVGNWSLISSKITSVQ